MLTELIKREIPRFKKFLIIEVCYVTFDVLTLVLVNAILGQIFPNETNFRALLMFFTALLINVALFLQAQKMSVQLIESFIGNIRWKILDKTQRADLLSFEKLGKSQILNAITLDTQTISDVAHVFRWICDCILLCTGLLTYQFLTCKLAFFFTACIYGIGGLIYAVQIVIAKNWIHKSREKEKELFDGISDVIYGFKELKVNDKKSDDFFHHALKVKTLENRKLRTKAENAFADSNILVSFIVALAFIPIIFILPASGDFTIHTMAVCVMTLLFFPFDTLKDVVPYLVKGWISFERINHLFDHLETLTSEQQSSLTDVKSSTFREIQYDDISFTYRDHEGNPLFSINHIDFSVHPGEIIFITGGNGSGKSTLLKVLTGLYSPFSGSIKIDGSEVNMADYRHLYSVIFSDFHLFDQLYGLPNIDEKKVQELLKIMQLEDKITFEGNQFSSLDLSTGQKKRVAMINMLLENKPIYVFDEWAADQAPHFREYFYNTLLLSFKKEGKTVIAVTHDDRFFHVADRVYKLDYGQLIIFPYSILMSLSATE
ncbi:MAG: cyclic peptide export ABC transporter [Desulfobacterales bacterium]|nr:cyclic peptide export ABC transporter [Desulfobacterales bacterium]